MLSLTIEQISYWSYLIGLFISWSTACTSLRDGGGTGGGSLGVMGAGGLREAGEEGARGGISKRGGSREKWEIFRNTDTIFRNRKSTWRREPLWKGAGTGSAGCGRWDVQTPCLPPPPPPPRWRDE